MYLTQLNLKALNQSLQTARTNHDEHGCQANYLQDGQPYRLEPKPKGRRHVLERAGFTCQDIGGVLHVQIPLGIHGTDNLAIDPATGEIVCLLCKGGK